MGNFSKAALISFLLLRSAPLFPTSGTWLPMGPGPDDWNMNANWTNPFPNGATESATFGASLNVPVGTVNVPVMITVGNISINNNNSYVISGVGPLIFNNTPSAAGINIAATSGAHTLSVATLTLSSNLTVNQLSSGQFTLSGTFGATTNSLTFTGSGKTILMSAGNMHTGTTISSGTVEVSADGALGVATGAVTIGSGTFQAGASFATVAGRGFTLNGPAVFDTQGHTLTINGVISGSGSLTKIGAGGTLVLVGANQYSGGTTVTSGTLSVAADANLGAASGAVSIGAATFQSTASFSSSRSVTLSGGIATFDVAPATTLALSGSIGGSGSLVTNNTGTLILTGSNSYTGGTTIGMGTLRGNSNGIQGAIVNNSALIFDQNIVGAYAGALSGGGTLTIQGGGTLTMSGNSSTFTGPTTLTGSTHLIMNGNLSMSPLSIAAGSALSGVGVVGTTMNAGTIVPGASGLGVLSVSGDVTFAPGSAMSVLIAPGGSSGRLAVSGTAFLLGNGTLTVTPTSGFYGLTQTYTLLNAGFVSGMFASHVITNPNFVGTFSYNPTSVTLFVQVLRPFQDFSYSNSNTRAVGTNIDELNASGSILPDMAAVLDTLAGQSDSVINEALDQMHPAAFSAFAELQAEVGGQLLSLFHRRPFLICGCSESNRLWVEPFGNWLKEKEQGEQIGFDATTRGIAFGYDREFFDCWSFGVGGAWNATDLTWKLDRGHAYTDGLYGAFYTDFYLDNFYLGGSVYAGLDWFTTARHIRFTTIDRQAEGHFNGLDIGGQFTAAYYFGSPACLFYPYGTVDYLYLNESSFSESGADSLDLNVGSYTSQTLRSEAGFAMQIIDKNYRETICLSPLISFGWAMEWPLDRSPYQSSFSEQTLPFIVHGWDQTWQLLNIRFGFGIVYRCFTLDSLYIADISPDGGSPFFNQRANFRLSYTF